MTLTTPIIVAADTILQMTLEEKIKLLSGSDMWHTAAIPRLGIPRVRLCDGPNGVRGTAFINPHPSSCTPCATGLAASFDTNLAYRIGVAIGAECRARGTHCILGPTTNVQRHPCGGRGFESFSEDPLLSGLMASSWIEGVHSQKVMTCPKHYVCNEQETCRRSSNSIVDERTLHEIYLEPFRLQAYANPDTMMTAYNQVNGLHASEDPRLLQDILRKDFRFSGLLMSDWGGTYSSKEAVEAGLDLEMPGPSLMRGGVLEKYVLSGKMQVGRIDECVLRILEFVCKAQLSGIPFEAEEGTIDTPQIRALLREAAGASVVLLKNDASRLPLKLRPGIKVAVIGPNADIACHAGGGSAHVKSTYKISPLAAIKEQVEAAGGTVSTCIGAPCSRWTPLLTPHLHTASDSSSLMAEFFDQNPFGSQTVLPLHTMTIDSSAPFFIDGIPETVPIRGYIRLTSTFIPRVSGAWILGLAVAGQAQLLLDGEILIENVKDQLPDVLFFNTGSRERTCEVSLIAGRSYEMEVQFSNFVQIDSMSPYAGRRGGMRIGGRPKYDLSEEISKAVALARSSDVTVIAIGTNGEWESESYDREDMKLPPESDELVQAVLAVDPNAIVVNQSGMPVELPWVDKATTIVQSFFGGNECGRGFADVLFGLTNPSGKLPVTWARSVTDYASNPGFAHKVSTKYFEGLHVGYRGFDGEGQPKTLFPFGHGLSYTKFAMADHRVEKVGPHSARVLVKVTNKGNIAGSEVVQVYVHALSSSVPKPDVELAGFVKVHIRPSECTLATINYKAFSYYCVDRKTWIVEKGEYEIQVGCSSTNLSVIGRFDIAQSFEWKGLAEPRPIQKSEGVANGYGDLDYTH